MKHFVGSKLFGNEALSEPSHRTSTHTDIQKDGLMRSFAPKGIKVAVPVQLG